MPVKEETSFTNFQTTVWEYYHQHGRSLPWRIADIDGSFDPYKIMISEYMLQQTQVSRVIPKYHAFLAKFPTITDLARAPLHEVLTMWSGLGYNRRAKYIHSAAREITTTHNGLFPRDAKTLATLPGIGANTAAAIITYSFNLPSVFIETNIRTVYIHHFFSDHEMVKDAAIADKVAATVDTNNPREWYWALMDYGTFLKTMAPSTHQKSAHFRKQTPFHGSKRKIRGEVLRMLTAGKQTKEQLKLHSNDARLEEILEDLTKEGLITAKGISYQLSE